MKSRVTHARVVVFLPGMGGLKSDSFDIVGAGIGGLCAAVALGKAGFSARVFEAAAELKPVGAGIMLGSNAVQALAHAGLENELKARAHVPALIRICDSRGKPIQQIDNERTREVFGFPAMTIHRAELQALLLEQLKPQSPAPGKKAMSAEQDEDGTRVFFEDGGESRADYLIAADGIHSRIRLGVLPESRPVYAGYTCWRGVTDEPPSGFDESLFTETWGPNGRFGIVPLKNGKVYWFAVVNAPPEDPLRAQYGPAEILDVFRDYHFPIPGIIESTPAHSIMLNDIRDIDPINQYAFHRIALLGDAAHAVTPNMGQGAGQAIEGAVILAECLKNNASPRDGFKAYEQAKMRKARWVAKSSRRLGTIAQLSNPVLRALRDNLFRLIPTRVNERGMRDLLTFDLPGV